MSWRRQPRSHVMGVPRVDGGRERWNETASALWPPSRSGCGLSGCGLRSFIMMDIGRCFPVHVVVVFDIAHYYVV